MRLGHLHYFKKHFLLAVLPGCLVACSTTYKADPKKTAATRNAITPADSLVQLQQRGIDFLAQGDAPVNWTLELDLEKGFYFKPAGSRLLFASPVPATTTADATTTVFETATDEGSMRVSVFEAPCAGYEKSNRPLKRTEITLNNKRYTGCGNYLYDPTLNDIWTLETIGNKNPEIPVKDLPWMEFNLEKNKVFGYDGCNTMNAAIIVEGNRVKFSPFTQTKKACPGNETAAQFVAFLSGNTVDYSINAGRLTFITPNETKLVFIKKE